MSLYDAPNLTGGIDNTLVEITREVPSFLIGFLMFIWGFVFMGGMASQTKRRGYADPAMWAVMASISTLMVTLVLSLTAGLINLEVLGIVVAITIMSGLWFFLSKGRGEA
tara:strand:+ start:352 stop:681 length:330 start_codon:yes stop_codon:yes gene_type:complete